MRKKGITPVIIEGGTQRIQKQFSLTEEIRDNLTISDNNFSGLKDMDYV